MTPIARFALLLVATLLAGCATTTAVAPCCYDGPVTAARLGELPLMREDGRRQTVGESLPGFQPGRGLLLRELPALSLEGYESIYASLIPLMPLYDANRDGRLEEPEMLVLTLREALLGIGVPVRHLGDAPGVWALATANADVDGLVRWIDANVGRMTPQAARVMRELVALGNEQRTRGAEHGQSIDDVYVP